MHEDYLTQWIATWVFLLEAGIVVLIAINWYFGENKQIKDHKQLIKYAVILQSLFITWMIISIIFTNYGKQFWPHALVGTFVYLLIIYTYLNMRRKLPKQLLVPNHYRLTLMKVTAVIWILTVGMGLLTYLVFPS